MKNIYLIVGRSGSGKSTLVKELVCKYGMKELLSYTTRPQRNENDTTHTFVNKDEALDIMINTPPVAFTVFDNNYYFATAEQVNNSDLFVCDPNGIAYFKNSYKGHKNVIVIGIDISRELSEQRMRIRGDSEEHIKERLINDNLAFSNYLNNVNLLIDGNNLDVNNMVEMAYNYIQLHEKHPYISIKVVSDNVDVVDTARTTVWKPELGKEPSERFMYDIYASEHSPIRAKTYIITYTGIPSWIATHFVRHNVGVTPFVSTQRDDRVNDIVDRDKEPQGALVNMKLHLNSQAIINISRKRLCNMAHPRTKQIWQDTVDLLKVVDPQLYPFCVPNCIYRGGICPEGKNSCKYNTTNHFKIQLKKYLKFFE